MADAASPRPLSGLLIAGAAEPDLPRAVASLLLRCAEVVAVVDPAAGETARAAREAGARVVLHPFRSFAEQKNAGVDAAQNDWILSLDADEILAGPIDEGLRRFDPGREEILYRLRRRNRYLGAWIDWTGWRRDAPVRLFNRRRARFTGGRVHERVEGAGCVTRRLPGLILHRPYRNLEHHLAKMNRYTTDAVPDGSGALWRLALDPPWKFTRMFLLEGGFLLGPRGFILSGTAAFYVFLKHAKRWEARHAPAEDTLPDA
jgi:glycosyltransferase involved in cell wall biosynthesis